MKILCVHQGYELYGSDRSFLASVQALRRQFEDARIISVLPAEGPLIAPLTQVSDRVAIEPLYVLRRRHLLRLIAHGWFSLPLALARTTRWMKDSDLVYINTVAVLDYLIAARFFRKKTILHVHEIPSGIAGGTLRFLVRTAKVRTIFNSRSTLDAFAPMRGGRSHVLYNGFDGPHSFNPPQFQSGRRLRVLLLGRLNSWKGQDVLIEACGRLSPEIRRSMDVRIVGSSFDSHVKLEQSLHQLVADRKCSECVTFVPFVDEPDDWYRWCDLVVVPSKRPEPFGRVVIEAMGFARGAIVSGTGGLLETVLHGKTGWHVHPNDPQALADSLTKAVAEPRWIEEFGRSARARYEMFFRQEIIDAEFGRIVQAQLDEGAGTPTPSNLTGTRPNSDCQS
jgi:glycosyltransferase involved in cell wall biosynthesis